MKRVKWLILISVLFFYASCNRNTGEIITCGDDQVLVIDSKASDKENVKVLWKWKASEATDLTDQFRKYMTSIDECKSVDKNKKILITSSGGGVVLIDRETKKSIFHAHVPNAHSAELLPGNRVVVALSTAPGGNSLEVYDVRTPEKVLCKDSLYSGHGVVWMRKTGYDELRRYTLKDRDSENPELRLEKTWKLPDTGGHDLSPVSDNKLILTTTNSVWIFNIKEEQFLPFEMLDQVKNVKSVNYNESNGELVYAKGEISWWTHNIYFRNPDKTLTLPDINLYKVRVISKQK